MRFIPTKKGLSWIPALEVTKNMFVDITSKVIVKNITFQTYSYGIQS